MATTAKDAKGYLASKEVPQLFESLMTGLLYNQPDDHITFLQSCLQRIKDESLISVKWNTFIDMRQSRRSGLPPVKSSPPKSDSKFSRENTSAEPLPPIRTSQESNRMSLTNGVEPLAVASPVVVFSGCLGSGAAHQAKRLVSELSTEHWRFVSAAEMIKRTNFLRKQSGMNDSTGKRSTNWQKVRDSASDVDDITIEALIDIISERQSDNPEQGLIIERYPSHQEQANSWAKHIGRLDLIVFFDCSETTLFQRMSRELSLSENAIMEQLRSFRHGTLPMIKEYMDSQRVYLCDAEKRPNELFDEVLELFQYAFYRPRDDNGSFHFDEDIDGPIASKPDLRPLGPIISGNWENLDSIVAQPVTKIDVVRLKNRDTGRKPGLPKVPILFVAGGPGSGKGTQCRKLLGKYPGFVHVSITTLAGRYLRQLGRTAGWDDIATVVLKGDILPSDEVIGLFRQEIMDNPDVTGFIVEGIPKDQQQLEAFNEQIGGLTFAVLIDCDEAKMMKCLLQQNKSADDARLEDNPIAIRRRMNWFKAMTLPILHHLFELDKLMIVNGDRPADDIFLDICVFLDFVVQPDEGVSEIAHQNQTLLYDESSTTYKVDYSVPD